MNEYLSRKFEANAEQEDGSIENTNLVSWLTWSAFCATIWRMDDGKSICRSSASVQGLDAVEYLENRNG